MSFSRKAISEAGLFDCNYVGDGYMVEADYCVRVKRRGFRIFYHPGAVVIHMKSEIRVVPRRQSPARSYYRSRNNTYYSLKNFMFGSNSLVVSKRMVTKAFDLTRRAYVRRDVNYACHLVGLIVGLLDIGLACFVRTESVLQLGLRTPAEAYQAAELIA
jgi:GT2 family glycosyltransferase